MESLDNYRGTILILAILIIFVQSLELLKFGYDYLDSRYVCIEKLSPPVKLPTPKKFMTSVGGFRSPPVLFSAGQCCLEACYTSGDPGGCYSQTVPYVIATKT